MIFKTTHFFVVFGILIFIELINGVRIKPGRWQYCHENSRLDMPGRILCINQYPGVCKTGENQSPINIVKKDRIKIKINDAFNFTTNSSGVFPVLKVENNGHSVKVTTERPSNEYYTMSGGGLNGSYEFDQAHLHWGSRNDAGSEHTIDGKHYAMEMHLVFWNKKFENSMKAVESGERDALAVLAILFKVDDKNKQLDQLFKFFKNVRQEGTHANYPNFPVYGIIPKKRNKFYRYHGSLTTPDCNEVVAWTIFKEKMEISQKEMNRLRKLKHGLLNETRTPISDNFRDAQPMNGRPLFYVKVNDDDDDHDHDDDDDDDK